MGEEERKMNICLNKRPRQQMSNMNGNGYNGTLAGVGPDGVYCHLVQMRGLPFKASDQDIRKFFENLKISGKDES